MTGSLASVHPELIPEWSEKNLPLTPDKITFGSNKRVWCVDKLPHLLSTIEHSDPRCYVRLGFFYALLWRIGASA